MLQDMRPRERSRICDPESAPEYVTQRVLQENRSSRLVESQFGALWCAPVSVKIKLYISLRTHFSR